MMGPQLGRGVPSRIMFATVIGYAAIAYLAGRLVAAVIAS